MPTPTSSNGISANPQPRPAIGRPADVEALGVKASPANADINSMGVNSQATFGVKNVDANTITGSHAGDSRAPNTGAGITDGFKSQAGPRGETTDTPNAGA